MDWAVFFGGIATDFGAFVTDFLTELPALATPALEITLAIAGVLLGIKLVKRFVR